MLLLRDDDPNATTRPERLERTYAPLLDAGLPITFAVVPEVALDTPAPDGRRERFIDEAAPCLDATVTLTADNPIAVWLRRHAGQVDVFQHGHTHRRGADGTEFGAIARADAESAVARGMGVLTQALGRQPSGFVPPWDVLSRGAVEATTRAYPLVSCGWISRDRLPAHAWPSFFAERVTKSQVVRVGDHWLARHRGGLIAPTLAPNDVPAMVDRLTQGARLGVLVLHHWMFWEREEPHPVIVALARALRGRHLGTARDAVAYLDAHSGFRARSTRGMAGMAVRS